MSARESARFAAAAVVDGPIEASAFFRPRIDAGPAPSGGGWLVGSPIAVSQAAIHLLSREPRVRGLPRPSYLAVTRDSVYVIEVTFGRATRVHRVAAHWRRDVVTARRTPGQPLWIDISTADGTVARLEAIDADEDSMRVIELLSAAA